MRERINRLAKGIIDMETPVIRIQPDPIRGEIAAGGTEKKELYITSRNGVHIKGLVYSSNPRVRILTGSFGGLRNRVAYEIDTAYLELGDEVSGVFSLVTNGGEMEVPYAFSVQAGVSGRALSKLKEVRDFASMAKTDYETAVRVFECREFADLPFMQDLKIRSLYDGLLGHGNRYGQVEQFLIALQAKNPVRIRVDDTRKEYRDLNRLCSDTIALHRSCWGYLPVEVKIDGGFILIDKRNFTNEEFRGSVYEFPFQISPGGLHGGRNYGSITFETQYESVRVEIAVINSRERAEEYPRLAGYACFADYLARRLEYESGKGDAETLKKQMLDDVSQIRLMQGPSTLLSLIEAELDLLTGRDGPAREALSECRDEITRRRLERPELYCLYQYVYLQLEPDEGRRESLGRLVRKYLEDGRGEYLLFYVFTKCEDQYCFENPGELLARMKVLFGRGCHSPFLYGQALAILNDAPQLLYGIGSFETQVLIFGAERGWIGEELAGKAAKLLTVCRQIRPLFARILRLLYGKYPKKEILEALCGLMIRGDCREEKDFTWYEKALSEGISLTRLYEYFLYSLPADCDRLLPMEVLRYFSYDHDLDQGSRAVLYANIIRYMDPETQLFREYERVMDAFAVDQVLKARIGSHLAVVYDAMIYPDMVNEPVAKVLPSILNSCRIVCGDRRMRQVIVCYEELTDEGVYPLKDGAAYVPIYFDGSSILFADAYGNRYADVDYERTPVMHRPELERKCFEVYPEHPMLLLAACREAAEKEKPEAEDVRVIDEALRKLKLHPLYCKKLAGRILCYYRDLPAAEDGELSRIDIEPLLSLEKELLTRDQLSAMCQVLILHGYIREAYRMLKRYYCQVSPAALKSMCSHVILDRLFDQDELLLKLAFAVFETETADGVILDYLCEYFNGLSDQMYRVLLQAVSERVETYDLEERLLAQMIFSDTTDRIERVFSLYMRRKKTDESIVKAYFTIKSTAYFLEGKPAGDEVFRYLEGMVHASIEKEKLSTIYLLALTRYYAGLEHLEEDQKELCRTIVDILLEDGLVFPYFKLLAKHIKIPDEIMDKAILQYNGNRDSRVELQMRIRPQEERFYKDEMKRVYQGIFIKQKVLFAGETMEYRIREYENDALIRTAEGRLTCDSGEPDHDDSRFRLLNRMSLYMDLKEESGLKTAMEEYVRKTAVVEGLFGIM